MVHAVLRDTHCSAEALFGGGEMTTPDNSQLHWISVWLLLSELDTGRQNAAVAWSSNQTGWLIIWAANCKQPRKESHQGMQAREVSRTLHRAAMHLRHQSRTLRQLSLA